MCDKKTNFPFLLFCDLSEIRLMCDKDLNNTNIELIPNSKKKLFL